ncbi:hypothetical protein ELI49_24185 [Rhizobium ruizarguesonis]|uniref:hypothetical protein n=1 Tax=Rhizobium ruizarguesonis TaxID=2081791 RepID=UPI0010312CED|nr:hypothetical protein [Rhizobium ruizarguesonis]TAU12638.1 hypothetical protein ELI49_24185 [Rhizobium ruizarguesonis]
MLQEQAMLLTRAWAWLANNDRQLLVCFAAIGGLYALVEYQRASSSDQKQAVARYVELYGAEHIMAARVALDAYQMDLVDQKVTAQTYGQKVGDKITDQRYVGQVLTTLNFFDALDICVASGECSRGAACEYFFSDAEAFIQNNRPILVRLLKGSEGDAISYVSDFAHNRCRNHMPGYCESVENLSVDCIDYKQN